MREEFVCLNGEFLASNLAKISIFDRGFLYGDAIFETLRSFSKKPFLLSEHLKRLKASLKLIGIELPLTDDNIACAINKLHELNNLSDAYIRITVSRGVAKGGLFATQGCEPTILIVVKEFVPYSKRLYDEGMSVLLIESKRDPSAICARIKSSNLLETICSHLEMEGQIDEAILMTEARQILEGSISNIFVVNDETLITPPVEAGLLAGVTRAFLLSLAKMNGIKGMEAGISLDHLLHSDEAFLTNSLMGIMPISRVYLKDKLIKRFQVGGPLSTKIALLYKELTCG